MKLIIKGVALFFFISIVTIVFIDISNSGVKKNETSSLSNNATYESLKIKLTGEYDLENDEELLGEVVRNIALNKYSDADVKIQVLGIDAKNGLLDINVIQTITHANGQTSTFEERRTVIVETEKSESHFIYDLNQDGIVNQEDVDYLNEYINGNTELTSKQKEDLDFDGDGEITNKDAEIFLEKINNSDDIINQKSE